MYKLSLQNRHVEQYTSLFDVPFKPLAIVLHRLHTGHGEIEVHFTNGLVLNGDGNFNALYDDITSIRDWFHAKMRVIFHQTEDTCHMEFILKLCDAQMQNLAAYYDAKVLETIFHAYNDILFFLECGMDYKQALQYVRSQISISDVTFSQLYMLVICYVSDKE